MVGEDVTDQPWALDQDDTVDEPQAGPEQHPFTHTPYLEQQNDVRWSRDNWSRCERMWRLEPCTCYVIECVCICIGIINVRFHSEADASACEGWNCVHFACSFRGRFERMWRLELRAFCVFIPRRMRAHVKAGIFRLSRCISFRGRCYSERMQLSRDHTEADASVCEGWNHADLSRDHFEADVRQTHLTGDIIASP